MSEQEKEKPYEGDPFTLSGSPTGDPRPTPPTDEHGPEIPDPPKSADIFSEGEPEDKKFKGFKDLSVAVTTKVFNLSRDGEAEEYSEIKTQFLRDAFKTKGSSDTHWSQLMWEEKYSTKEGHILVAVCWSEYTKDDVELDDLLEDTMTEGEYQDDVRG